MASNLEDIALALRARLGSNDEDLSTDQDEEHRFELFHASNSICSHKVRAVLAYHGIPFCSQLLDLSQGHSYYPEYVRLRLSACKAIRAGLVEEHVGGTAVVRHGCDPAVVPTLIDWRVGLPLADSRRICVYLDRSTYGSKSLYPSEFQAAIDEEVDWVDDMPNYQLLFGKAPETWHKEGAGPPNSAFITIAKKIAFCDRYSTMYADDLELVQAYKAKRLKEFSAGQQLFTPEAMVIAYNRVEIACDHLNNLLGVGSRWVLGSTFTLADVFWGVQLKHLKNLGLECFWAGGRRPALGAFLDRVQPMMAW